jgi:hypothetical protein
LSFETKKGHVEIRRVYLAAPHPRDTKGTYRGAIANSAVRLQALAAGTTDTG